MLPLLTLCSCLLHTAVSIPLPNDEVTLDQFREGARGFDFDTDKNNFVISGYSQVRRQGGGRALATNYKFPTQTVASPNQLNIESFSKVKVNLANPVYNQEAEQENSNIQFIANKIEAINQNEGARLKQLEQEDKAKKVLEAAQEKVTAVMEEVKEIKEELEQELEEVAQLDEEAVVDEEEQEEVVEEALKEEDPEVEEAEAATQPELVTVADEEIESMEINVATLQPFVEIADAVSDIVDQVDVKIVDSMEDPVEEALNEANDAVKNLVETADTVIEDAAAAEAGEDIVEEVVDGEVASEVSDAAVEEEDEEGSGQELIIEERLSEPAELLIEEVVISPSSPPPLIDFGDIQEI